MGRNNNNNVLASVNNSINNLNKNVKKVVSNDILVNSIRVLIIIYATFVIPELSVDNLKFINNNIVRLVVIALIVYLSFLDMVTALLLLVAFILTIHHSKSARMNNNHNNLVTNNNGLVNAVNNLTRGEVENFNEQVKNNVEVNEALNTIFSNNSDIDAANEEESQNVGSNLDENLNNNGLVNTIDNSREILNEQVNSVPDAFDAEKNTNSVVNQVNNAEKVNNNNNNNNNNLSTDQIINLENENHPSSETMTDNILRAKGAKNDQNAPVGLTTARNLYDISENAVPGADINDQMLTFQNQHGIQGMDNVSGPNVARHNGYHYNNEAERPNLTSEMVLDRRTP